MPRDLMPEKDILCPKNQFCAQEILCPGIFCALEILCPQTLFFRKRSKKTYSKTLCEKFGVFNFLIYVEDSKFGPPLKITGFFIGF